MRPTKMSIVKIASVSLLVPLLSSASAIALSEMGAFPMAALAQTDGSGQGGKSADKGNQGEGQKGQDNQGQGQGQGGPDETSDGKGPQAGAPASSGGGKPVWASEGIPEVELGRLSVARSPDKVLESALDEAAAALTGDVVDFYNMSLDDVILALSTDFENVTFIDSPLQNLALLQDVLEGGTTMSSAGVTSSSATLVAILLGTASDKTIPISTDTVIAVTTILGVPLTDESAASIAAAAEAVRIAILAGHG